VREGGDESGTVRNVVYCVVPRDLAATLHQSLKRHFADDRGVEVVVEQRVGERRAGDDRRGGSPAGAREPDRRRIRASAGRRAGERRALVVPVSPPSLPRRARPYADRLAFVARLEPSTQQAEDVDTARVVARIQAGESDLFSVLYMRYFDRVFSYLRVVLNDEHAAEDATQQVFLQMLLALPRYQRRRQPFRAWMFTIVRNRALDELKKRRRVDVEDPAELQRLRDEPLDDEAPVEIPGWLFDRDLLLFIERLPLAQRQVLLLRYMLDLSTSEIAETLGRNPAAINVLHYRALSFLRARLRALGRTPQDFRRSGVYRRHRQARVLRQRRFALLS
jgi:RNA polymerase sigma-70 factor (ECF subfamily)